MKICIQGAAREGKTRLLEVIRKRVLDDYGAEVTIWDGGERPSDFIQGGSPSIEVLVTNDPQEAAEFFQEDA